MNYAVDTSLCPNGTWMVEDVAMKHLNIDTHVMYRYRNGTHPINVHVEHGRYVKAPEPYKQCLFLYITAEGAPATKYSITLRQWSRVCEHFSNDDNINTANNNTNSKICRWFEKYTGVTATPYNIRRAIADGVIIQSTELQNHIVLKQQTGQPSKSKPNPITPAKANPITPPPVPENNNSNNNNNNATATGNNIENTINNNSNTIRGISGDNLADELLPSTSELTAIVVDRMTSLGFVENIKSDSTLTFIADVMKLKKLQRIQFEGKDARGSKRQMIFSTCQDCNNYRVCQLRNNTGVHCRKCSFRQAGIKKRDKRRQENSDARTATGSHTAFSNLTTAEITKRVSDLNKERRCKEMRYKRLLAKLNETQIELKNMSEEMQDTSIKAMQYAMDNQHLLREELQKVLLQKIMEEQNDSIGGRSLSVDEVKPLIDMIIEQIKNQVRVMNGKKKQCKFSSKLLGVAMSLYLRSGKKAYDNFCDGSQLIYPSANYLAKIKQSQKINDGECVTMYEDQLKIRGKKIEGGQICCDEMKLRKDVLLNVMSDEVVV